MIRGETFIDRFAENNALVIEAAVVSGGLLNLIPLQDSAPICKRIISMECGFDADAHRLGTVDFKVIEATAIAIADWYFAGSPVR